MGYKIVINGEDVEPTEVSEYIGTYKQKVIETAVTDSDHGNDPAACFGWNTNIIEVLAIASFTFFSIPIATKKIRESCIEWKNIYNDLNSFFKWLNNKHDIHSYSIDVVFLDALKHLESQTEIMDLNLTHYIELPTPKDKDESNFDYTTRIYYQFIFENNETGNIYVLLYNSQREMLIDGELGMYIGNKNEIKTISN